MYWLGHPHVDSEDLGLGADDFSRCESASPMSLWDHLEFWRQNDPVFTVSLTRGYFCWAKDSWGGGMGEAGAFISGLLL